MISLVSTVFNDLAGLKSFLFAMMQQNTMPDELVIVDGGSKDGSWELLQQEAARIDRSWRLIARQEIGCNVARGRDLAIQAAEGEMIVSTDIGCNWDAQWLEELVKPLEMNPAVDLVIGSWAVKKDDLEGAWAITEWALKGDQRLEATENSYSSSRSIAYRKKCWEALGKYPEDLTLAGDDAVFHYLIEKAQVALVGAPVVRCWWHRHTTLKGFLKEAFRYGLGDGEAGIRRKDVALVGGRLVIEVVGVLLVATAFLPVFSFDPWLGLFGFLVAAVSIVLKILKLRTATTRLRKERVKYPLLHLIAFTYASKFYWLRGYFKGSLRGAVHCRDCRHRLQMMSPALYRYRLASLCSQT